MKGRRKALPKTTIKEAKTVEEAIRLACEELDIDREDAEIEVIEEGNKGILGFIGNKNAVVKVTQRDVIEELIVDFLNPIFVKMQINADIEIERSEGAINITLTGDDIGIIIGRRGETLDALQYLLSLIINRRSDHYVRVILDVANYRHKREETLKSLAKRIAERVARTRRNVTLEPMNPYERRIIHYTLQNYKNVYTESIGEEPNRKIVIRYSHSHYR
jgi:spoIIIJ-associated protein